MNAQRRKEIDKIARTIIDSSNATMEIAEGERESWESLPDGLQETEKADRMDEVSQELDEIACELEGLADRLIECLG